jgi:hypothetical protein
MFAAQFTDARGGMEAQAGGENETQQRGKK